MKCLALGLSAAMVVFFGASVGAAQNAPPSPAPAETTPPSTGPAAPLAPTTTAPNLALPNPSAPNPAAPNPAAPNPAAPNPAAPMTAPSTPIANSAPNPTAAPPQYPYPSYGYPNPYAGYGWGTPTQPPAELPYKKGQAVPYGYKVEERYNLGLLIAGPTLFGLAYLITAYSANERPGIGDGTGFQHAPWDSLYVPITGPFAFSPYAPAGSAFIYVFEGIAQVTGVGLFLGSILFPKDILVRQNAGEAFRPTLRVGPARVQLEMRF